MKQPLKALKQLGDSLMGTAELPVEDDVASRFADDAEIPLRGFAFFLIRIHEADRSLVGLHVAAFQKVTMHQPVDRVEPIGHDPDPVSHTLAGELRSPVRGHLFLPVEGQMVEILVQRDIGDQL